MDVLVTDATTTGGDTARLLLQGVPSPLTLRDLIRFRVREEVARYNANPAPRFSGLVRPSDAEADLNGYALSRRRRRLDWEVQAETAIQAFERNGFFVFVGDRQVDDLDAELALADHHVVSFVRLVPLAGG
jgi:hypothetical protein